jgi:uncharacterized protein (TIGR00369 family)
MTDRATLQQYVDASPFGVWWGLVVESAGGGTGRVRLPYRAEFLRLGGVLHGACAMIVADVASWVAIIAEVDGGEQAVTVHLATEYLAPARTDIVAEARLVKVGRRLAIATAETRTIDGELVAIHNVTYALR